MFSSEIIFLLKTSINLHIIVSNINQLKFNLYLIKATMKVQKSCVSNKHSYLFPKLNLLCREIHVYYITLYRSCSQKKDEPI